MASVKHSSSHKTDNVNSVSLSVGDLVRWGRIPARVVGFSSLFPGLVYLVALTSCGDPEGEVMLAPLSELYTYLVGSTVSFLLNGERVSAVVRSYDSFGRCVVRLCDDFLPNNPIRFFRLSPAELLEVA